MQPPKRFAPSQSQREIVTSTDPQAYCGKPVMRISKGVEFPIAGNQTRQALFPAEWRRWMASQKVA
jgi:hypothetical protein